MTDLSANINMQRGRCLTGKLQHALAHLDHVSQCSCLIGAVHPANSHSGEVDVATYSLVSEQGIVVTFRWCMSMKRCEMTVASDIGKQRPL